MFQNTYIDYLSEKTRCDSLVVSDSDSRTEGPRFESPLVHLKDFSFICCLEIPWLTFRPWLRQANPLESLQVGYWGWQHRGQISVRDRSLSTDLSRNLYLYSMLRRITTADPSPRDRVYEQSEHTQDVSQWASGLNCPEICWRNINQNEYHTKPQP